MEMSSDYPQLTFTHIIGATHTYSVTFMVTLIMIKSWYELLGQEAGTTRMIYIET